jgi:hypothetical protein
MAQTAAVKIRPRLSTPGLALAFLSWVADLVASYPMVEWACTHDRLGLVQAVGIGTLILALGGVALCVLDLRAARRERVSPLEPSLARLRFTIAVKLALSVLFVLSILMLALPRFVLSPCEL